MRFCPNDLVSLDSKIGWLRGASVRLAFRLPVRAVPVDNFRQQCQRLRRKPNRAIAHIHAAAVGDGSSLCFDVIHAEWLVRYEQDDYVSLGASSVLHNFPFGKPDERTLAEGSFVCYKTSFQNVHSMATRMRVARIDDPRWITDEAYLDPRLRVYKKLFTKKRLSNFRVGALFPGLIRGVDDNEFSFHHFGYFVGKNGRTRSARSL